MDISAVPKIHTTSHHSKLKVFITAIVLVVGLIGAGFIPFFNGYSFWHRVVAAHELTGIYVTQGSHEPVAPYEFGIMKMKPHKVVGLQGSLGDFAEAGDTRLAIVRASENQTAQVQQFSPVSRKLSIESGVKAMIAVSKDESYSAYSIATSTDQFSPKLSTWSIVLVTLSTGQSSNLGAGFGPQFFTYEGKNWLLYTTKEGITMIDLKENKFFSTPFNFLDNVGFMAKISPDGSYIALRDGAGGRFGIYKTSDINTSLPLHVVPTPAKVDSADDITLSLSSVYTTKFIDKKVFVDALPYTNLSQNKTIYTFSAEAPYRLIP